MSREAVHDLLAKAEADPVVTKRLEDALADEDDAVASFLAVAAEQGCEFTADEFVEVMEAVLGEDRPRELAEPELSAATGGAAGLPVNAYSKLSLSRLGRGTR